MTVLRQNEVCKRNKWSPVSKSVSIINNVMDPVKTSTCSDFVNFVDSHRNLFCTVFCVIASDDHILRTSATPKSKLDKCCSAFRSIYHIPYVSVINNSSSVIVKLL